MAFRSDSIGRFIPSINCGSLVEWIRAQSGHFCHCRRPFDGLYGSRRTTFRTYPEQHGSDMAKIRRIFASYHGPPRQLDISVANERDLRWRKEELEICSRPRP